MTYELLAAAVRRPAETAELDRLRDFVRAEHPADLANFVGGLQPEAAWAVLGLLPLAERAEAFGYLGRDRQVTLAGSASRADLARIVTKMNSDERADLFNAMSDEQRAALLPALAQAEREDIRRMAGYAEETAGAVMTSDYAVLTEALTVTEALEKLRREAPDKETIYRTYVIDADRRLIGSVRLRDLIVAPDRARVADIMDRNTLAIPVDEDQEAATRARSRRR
jgi:magnesium transporter